MNKESLNKLLRDLYDRKLTPKKAAEQLKTLPYENLDFARIDHHRHLRSGMPETIYCKGKSAPQLTAIIKKMHKAGSNILATRLEPDIFKKIKKHIPAKAVYREVSRTLTIINGKKSRKTGSIIIVTAGTSDIPVAEEAEVTADLLGSQVDRLYDVGVAGIHRLLDKVDRLREARVVIVVAGMDGALPSVVGGLIEKPIVAVPTSVGYGASFKGLSALLTMLNSCAAGIATVNIDNGFGAGCLAHKINVLPEDENIR